MDLDQSKQLKAWDNLYFDYLKEREGFETYFLKNESNNISGFGTYQIRENVKGRFIYLRDIYVVPHSRNQNKATQIAKDIEAIGKINDCVKLVGTVCPQANHSTESLKVLLSYGFKLLSCDSNMIYFEKEI